MDCIDWQSGKVETNESGISASSLVFKFVKIKSAGQKIEIGLTVTKGHSRAITLTSRCANRHAAKQDIIVNY